MAMDCELYVITDPVIGRGRSHEEIARLAFEGGADIVQLRDKTLGADQLVRIGRRIAKYAGRSNRLFIVNDRLDIAIACHADGVHLGQGDIPASVARRIAPRPFIIGVSVSTPREAAMAAAAGADYLAASPVFPTGSKPDARGFCGLEGIRRIRAATPLPLVAIGGITRENTRDVIRAGADGIAVISAVVSHHDIAEAARDLKQQVLLAKKGNPKKNGGYPGKNQQQYY